MPDPRRWWIGVETAGLEGGARGPRWAKVLELALGCGAWRAGAAGGPYLLSAGLAAARVSPTPRAGASAPSSACPARFPRPVAAGDRGPCVAAQRRVRVRTREPRSPGAAAVSHLPVAKRGAPRLPLLPSQLGPAGEAPPPRLRSQAGGGREPQTTASPRGLRKLEGGVQANERPGAGLGRGERVESALGSLPGAQTERGWAGGGGAAPHCHLGLQDSGLESSLSLGSQSSSLHTPHGTLNYRALFSLLLSWDLFFPFP